MPQAAIKISETKTLLHTRRNRRISMTITIFTWFIILAFSLAWLFSYDFTLLKYKTSSWSLLQAK